MIKTIVDFCVQTVDGFLKDKVTTLSAALSYYAAFSLGPLLLLIISIAGLVLSREVVQQDISVQLESFLGKESADTLQSIIQSEDQQRRGIIGIIVGTFTLLLGALGVFGQLKDSLNLIWGVTTKPGFNVWRLLRGRVLSLGMVVIIAFLLLVSFAVSAGISAFSESIGQQFLLNPVVVEAINIGLSFVIATVLFALIYVVLPDVRIPWKAALIGALVASVLFTVGKSFLGSYIGSSTSGSSYGAAGSLIAVLLWVYYTSLIVFFGAEVVKEYMMVKGVTIEPNTQAVEAKAPIRQSSEPMESKQKEADTDTGASVYELRNKTSLSSGQWRKVTTEIVAVGVLAMLMDVINRFKNEHKK